MLLAELFVWLTVDGTGAEEKNGCSGAMLRRDSLLRSEQIQMLKSSRLAPCSRFCRIRLCFLIGSSANDLLQSFVAAVRKVAVL